MMLSQGDKLRLNIKLATEEEVCRAAVPEAASLKEVKVRKYGMGIVVSGVIWRMACMEMAILSIFRLYNVPLSKAYFS